MTSVLAESYPGLARSIPRLPIADLPTPVSEHRLSLSTGSFEVAVKHDEITSTLYGGNKVRKLEYLLMRARLRKAQRVATFGAAGSNHALATAIHAAASGLPCTCFLSHQKVTPNVARTLNMHRKLGTEIIRWGGGIDQVALFREHLQGRSAWVIPLGGTCWLGSVGFVNAGLELARQIAAGAIARPNRIYIACGTTGSAAGLALGIAAAGIDSTVHTVQVADNPFANEQKMRNLISKTLFILNRYDPSFQADGWSERIVWRDEFLAGGYARTNEATEEAARIAADQLGIALETTYTAKALTAMLHDLETGGGATGQCLFWNTYHSRPLLVPAERPDAQGTIPAEFDRYFEW
jgi:D-cysteine desulfhydrase